MELHDELEQMAVNIAEGESVKDTVDDLTVQRWMKLFGYSHDEAEEKIQYHHSDLLGVRVSSDLWDLAREQMGLNGYYRETCEHLVSIGKQQRKAPETSGTSRKTTAYLIKLDGPFLEPEVIRVAAGLAATPKLLTGDKLHNYEDILSNTHGAEGVDTASFYQVDGAAKGAIMDWLAENGSTYRPTFVQITQAEKDLSTYSLVPYLGLTIDPTLPQHRATSVHAYYRPSQSEYSVWYFFYGILAEPSILSWVLELPSNAKPQYRPALMRGGILVAWGGKYRAMVDAPGEDNKACVVQGKAFLVEDEELERQLRFFQTGQCEVARCDIKMLGFKEVVRGLTFRLIEAYLVQWWHIKHIIRRHAVSRIELRLMVLLEAVTSAFCCAGSTGMATVRVICPAPV